MNTMEKSFNATIIDRKEVAEDTCELTFKIDSTAFSFVPGQYVWIVLPELIYPDERGNRRAFSIVSTLNDEDNTICCTFRKSNSGFKKSLVSMPLGSVVRIDGPFGSCVLPQDETIPSVFLVGGIGVASVFTMINHATQNKSSRHITLIYANSNPGRAAYLSELENLERENKNFTLVSHFGDLNQKTVFDNTKELVNPMWYIFGPEAMVFRIGEILIKNHIPLSKIETEEFGLSIPLTYKENKNIIRMRNGVIEGGSLDIALNAAFNHIIVTDANGFIVYANHGAELITGYSVKELIGNTPRLWGGLMDGAFYKSLWKVIKEDQQVFEGEVRNRKKSGEVYNAWVKISPFFNPKNQSLLGFVGVEEDITKEKEIEKLRVDFLTLASHQLRTPLSGTKWMIETLQRGTLGKISQKQKEYIDDLYQLNERMIKLVSDMLNVLRLEGGVYL